MARREQKKRSASRRDIVLTTIGLFALVVVAVVLTRQHQAAQSQRVYDEALANLHRTMNRQLNRHTEDRWLDIEIEPTEDDGFVKTSDQLRQIEARVIRLVNDCRSVSPRADSITSYFTRIHATVFWNGISRSLYAGTSADSIAFGWNDGLEICFVPEKDGAGQPSLLWYRADWQALMFALIDWPDRLLQPLLMHELDHAYGHLVLGHTPQEDQYTYFLREARAYDLEILVDDRVTDGEFLRLIDAIIDRSASEDHPLRAVCAITNDDLNKFDRMFKVTREGPLTVGPLYATVIYAIGARHIERHIPADGSRSASKFYQQNPGRDPNKVEMYKWMTTIFAS